MGVKEKRAAETLLDKVGPVHCPVDVEAIAAHLGLTIRYVDMGELSSQLALGRELDAEKSSGLLDVPGKTIYINKRHHRNRQRFTIAHEIGHFQMHQDVALKFLDVAFFTRDERVKNWVETEANNFAAHLLAPKALLERESAQFSYQGTIDLDGLAKHFGLSQSAMSIRVNNYLLGE